MAGWEQRETSDDRFRCFMEGLREVDSDTRS